MRLGIIGRRNTSTTQSETTAESGGPSVGFIAALVIMLIGVVFTAWYTARGPDMIDRLTGTPPITIGHVSTDLESQDIALREPVTDPAGRRALLGAHRPPDEWQALLTRHKAAAVGQITVTVVLTGNRSSLRIVEIKPRIKVREPLSDGAFLAVSTEGVTETVAVKANLDETSPRFVTADNPRVRYFSAKQIDLKEDERVTLEMTISAKKAYYEFDLVATVLADEHSEQVVITAPGGSPFQVTGEAETYRSLYTRAQRDAWAPMPQARVCQEFPKTGTC
jgi:hypothetical protein